MASRTSAGVYKRGRNKLVVKNSCQVEGLGGGIPVLYVLNDEIDNKKLFVEEVKEWTLDSMQRLTPVNEPRVLTPEEVQAYKSLHLYGIVIYTRKLLGGVAGWLVSITYISTGATCPTAVSSSFEGVAFSTTSAGIDFFGTWIQHSDDMTEVTTINEFQVEA